MDPENSVEGLEVLTTFILVINVFHWEPYEPPREPILPVASWSRSRLPSVKVLDDLKKSFFRTAPTLWWNFLDQRMPFRPCFHHTLASAWDFQQCGILTSVGTDEPVLPSLKLRNSKWCSVGSLIIIEYSSDLKGSDQTAGMQADLKFCWSHVPYCSKSHALAQFLWYPLHL